MKELALNKYAWATSLTYFMISIIYLRLAQEWILQSNAEIDSNIRSFLWWEILKVKKIYCENKSQRHFHFASFFLSIKIDIMNFRKVRFYMFIFKLSFDANIDYSFFNRFIKILPKIFEITQQCLRNW